MTPRSADFADKTSVEAGSFRDPESRVFTTEDGVFRALTTRGLEDFQALADTPVWRDLQEAGTVVATEFAESTNIPEQLGLDAVAVLRHERIPFVSYPYEWTFSVLQDAALVQPSRPSDPRSRRHAERRVGLQRAVAGKPTRVHRRRLVRAPATR